MKPISIVIIVISLFEAYRAWRQTVEGKISPVFSIFWISTWAAIILFLIFPGIVDTLASYAGMEERMVFLLVCGIMILYLITYNIFINDNKRSASLIKLTRRLALLEHTLEKAGIKTPIEEPEEKKQEKKGAS